MTFLKIYAIFVVNRNFCADDVCADVWRLFAIVYY